MCHISVLRGQIQLPANQKEEDDEDDISPQAKPETAT